MLDSFNRAVSAAVGDDSTCRGSFEFIEEASNMSYSESELCAITGWHVGADANAVTLRLAEAQSDVPARVYVLSADQALDLAGGIAQALARTAGKMRERRQ